METADPNVLARLMVLEKQSVAIETNLANISQKLDEIRIQTARTTAVPKLEEKLDALEKAFHGLRNDFDSSAWMRKLGLSLTTAVLLVVAGWVLTAGKTAGDPASNQQLEEALKRLLTQEYKH